MAIIAFLSHVSNAQADPDLCAIDPLHPRVVCVGDQSDGISFPPNDGFFTESYPDADQYEFLIENPTTEIAPALDDGVSIANVSADGANGNPGTDAADAARCLMWWVTARLRSAPHRPAGKAAMAAAQAFPFLRAGAGGNGGAISLTLESDIRSVFNETGEVDALGNILFETTEISDGAETKIETRGLGASGVSISSLAECLVTANVSPIAAVMAGVFQLIAKRV